MTARPALTLAAALFYSAAAPAAETAGENWPQWRGPAGTGATPAAGGPTEFGPERNVKWRAPLPEPGNSTPVVWGDKVFLTQPVTGGGEDGGDLRGLFCFDRATGKELWRRGLTYTDPERTHRTNPYCSASPAADAERVVAWFGSAGLVCWDHDGNELWRRDLGEQSHDWGYGTSPIFYENLCVLNFGPGDREFLVAVEKATGETVWTVDALGDAAERALGGPEDDGGANDYARDDARGDRLRGSWSTPLVLNVDGRAELVVTLPRRVSAFDPRTGELLWTCGGLGPLAYASPAAAGDVVVGLGGYGGAALAVRAGGEGDVTDSRRLWHGPRGAWLGTGATAGGVLYVCDMRGTLHALDVLSGEDLWKARAGGDGGGGTWGSVTATGDGRMVALTKNGAATLFRPDREEFKVLAVNELGERTNASVVAAGAEWFVRTDEALWCFAGAAGG